MSVTRELKAVFFSFALLFQHSARAQTTKGPLKILRPVISQSEDGTPIQSGETFLPGEQLFFSCQVENYRIGDNGKVQLTAHAQAFDLRGTPIAPKDEQVIGTSVGEEDKSWKPKFRFQIQIPSIAPPGTYRIKFDVSDRQNQQVAWGEAAFSVGGRGVDPSPALVIRNLGFYRTQDESAALKIPAYRAGDLLWVRFDITGYKYGEQNSIDVAYDVAVSRSNGERLFSQEDAAVERSQAFYPQPWIPAEFNLTLQSIMSTGTYTLSITARDGTGHQTDTARAAFRVE